MHAHTQELLTHLDDGRRALLAAFEAIPEGDRARRPADGRWSAANVLSHLARTEGQIGAFLQRRLRTALADGALPTAPVDAPPVLASLDGAAVMDRGTRFQAPDFALPDEAMGAAEAAAALERARERLRSVLLAADGTDTSAIRQDHHVFGALTFLQWVAFAGLHERRHTEQLVELRAEL